MPRTSVGDVSSQLRPGRANRTGVVVDRLPAPVRKTRYPWSEWTDGQPRIIWFPQHFQATTSGMRSTIMTHAAAHDIAVAIVMHPRNAHALPELSLAFQFFPGRSYAEGPPKQSSG